MGLKQRVYNYIAGKQPAREPRFPHLDRELKVMLIYEIIIHQSLSFFKDGAKLKNGNLVTNSH